jgi:hypothetical protein
MVGEKLATRTFHIYLSTQTGKSQFSEQHVVLSEMEKVERVSYAYGFFKNRQLSNY